MKIASAQMQMASTHASLQQHSVRESLKMWVGRQRPDFALAPQVNALPANNNDWASLSEAGKSAQSADDIKNNMDDAVNRDPHLNLIRQMLEFLTGKKINVFDSTALQASSPEAQPTDAATSMSNEPATPAGYGVEYDYHESYTEIEETSFSASGQVKTADGREISFDLQLTMTRSYHEETNVSLRLGDAVKTDPLVLNFAGSAAQLTDQRFAFDLNADGRAESINFVGQGSGFLVFDRNQDGKINNGGELFGPGSGNGFSELSQLDQDHNGWIDENDPQFTRLQLWSKLADGSDQLQSLSKAGVGAIALAQISTPFALKNSDNHLLGEVRSSGIFLQESGEAGTIQQIDLTA